MPAAGPAELETLTETPPQAGRAGQNSTMIYECWYHDDEPNEYGVCDICNAPKKNVFQCKTCSYATDAFMEVCDMCGTEY